MDPLNPSGPLTAAEARELQASRREAFREVYRNIRYMADLGLGDVIARVSDEVVRNKLHADGFTLEPHGDDRHTFTIRW